MTPTLEMHWGGQKFKCRGEGPKEPLSNPPNPLGALFGPVPKERVLNNFRPMIFKKKIFYEQQFLVFVGGVLFWMTAVNSWRVVEDWC